MLAWIEEITMKFLRFGAIDFVRFFRCFETPKVGGFSVNCDERRPKVVVLGNSFVPRFIAHSFDAVGVVPFVVALTKVAKSVIRRIAVNMVYQVLRPFTVSQKPSKPVVQIPLIVDNHCPVAIGPHSSGHISGVGVTAIDKPRQNTSVFVVFNKLLESFKGKFGTIRLAHGLSPSDCGKWQQGISVPLLPRIV